MSTIENQKRISEWEIQDEADQRELLDCRKSSARCLGFALWTAIYFAVGMAIGWELRGMCH